MAQRDIAQCLGHLERNNKTSPPPKLHPEWWHCLMMEARCRHSSKQANRGLHPVTRSGSMSGFSSRVCNPRQTDPQVTNRPLDSSPSLPPPPLPPHPQTAQYSTQIFSLAVLLSSLFVYNQVGPAAAATDDMAYAHPQCPKALCTAAA